MYMVLPLAKPNSLSAAAPIIIIPIILSISGGRGGFLAVFFATDRKRRGGHINHFSRSSDVAFPPNKGIRAKVTAHNNVCSVCEMEVCVCIGKTEVRRQRAGP